MEKNIKIKYRDEKQFTLQEFATHKTPKTLEPYLKKNNGILSRHIEKQKW